MAAGAQESSHRLPQALGGHTLPAPQGAQGLRGGHFSLGRLRQGRGDLGTTPLGVDAPQAVGRLAVAQMLALSRFWGSTP